MFIVPILVLKRLFTFLWAFGNLAHCEVAFKVIISKYKHYKQIKYNLIRILKFFTFFR